MLIVPVKEPVYLASYCLDSLKWGWSLETTRCSKVSPPLPLLCQRKEAGWPGSLGTRNEKNRIRDQEGGENNLICWSKADVAVEGISQSRNVELRTRAGWEESWVMYIRARERLSPWMC